MKKDGRRWIASNGMTFPRGENDNIAIQACHMHVSDDITRRGPGKEVLETYGKEGGSPVSLDNGSRN